MFVEKAIERIKKKKTWRFAIHPTKVTMPDANMPGSIREESAGEIYPSKISFIPQKEQEVPSFEVQWYQTSRMDRNDRLIFHPRTYDFKGTKILDSAIDADEIFFLACVMPICETYNPIKQFTNSKVAAPVFYVVDNEADAELENELEDLETRFKAKLFGDFALEEEKIRELAASFGILNAMDKELVGVNLLKKDLKNKILARDSKYRFDKELVKEFLDLAANDKIPKIKSTIQTAVEKKIITTRMESGKVFWRFLDEEGEETSDLLVVMGGADPNQKLVAFLASNKDVLENLTELVSNKK